MRRFFFYLLLLSISLCHLFSQTTSELNTNNEATDRFIFQFGLGSFYSSYSSLITDTIDTMDQDSLVRIPGSIYFQAGKAMSKKLTWNGSVLADFDNFSSDSGLFQIYKVLLSGGIEFIPFPINLTTGMSLGLSVLIPNTDLDYNEGVEVGSTFSISTGYMFKTLKFGKSGIFPGIKIKLIHSELFRGQVNQISIYLNLTTS